jgi:fibro-slime domain-containing protein
LITTIYDSDASLHGAFSCAPGWSPGVKSNYNACYYPTAKYSTTITADTTIPCIGVTTGMVEPTLDPQTKKLKLTAKGQKCFGEQADEAFAALFTATPGINESYLFNIPFHKNFRGKLEFNSDTYQSKGATVPGGFYPAEVSPNDGAMLSERLPAAESKRRADGPVFYCTDPTKNSKYPDGLRTIDATEKVPVYNLICNGPGWDKGIDCEGIYIKGNEFGFDNSLTPLGEKISEKIGVAWSGDGWGWSCTDAFPIDWPLYTEGSEALAPPDYPGASTPRWTSIEQSNDVDGAVFTTAGRNHHFCLESHARFKYKKGLNFSIDGNDDIWVYINNKLAVDVGGVHMSAPGYVDVDKFLPSAKLGDIYDIDIYFCNRRNPSSTLQITTNMILEQSTIDPSDPHTIASRRISSDLRQFRIAKTGTLEITIVTGKQKAAKQYALIDMKGQVLSTGPLNSTETRVKVPTSGTYIVKVGHNHKKVNVK